MANIAEIMELYTAYFNRAADRDGVDYWAKEMDTKAWTLDDVAKSFADQPEYDALYAGKTNAQIVALVYTNVLGRAAEAAGANYWETQLNDGAVPVSQLIQAVVNSATEKDANGDYVHATDAAIVNNKTAVSQYAYDSNVNAKDISLAGVTEDEASTQSAKNQIDAKNPANIGETFMLTKGLDNLVGTDKNDTFVGSIDTAAAPSNVELNTMSSIDRVNGGEGIDTLEVSAVSDIVTTDLATMTSIEQLEVLGGKGVDLDTTSIDGLTKVIVTKAGVASADTTNLTTLSGDALYVKASDEQSVDVSGATGNINIAGGKDVVVNDKTTNTTIDVGQSGAGNTNAAGTITVTDTDNSGANAITVNGGTDVTVTATTKANATGIISVGDTVQATGDVKVTQNLNSDGEATLTNSGKILVEGGKTVDVTVNATTTAKTNTSNSDITIGAITVIGDSKTTDVTVTQNKSVTTKTADTVAQVDAKSVVTFVAMAKGESTTVNGLTFTASKALTAAEVASAFANLTLADTQTPSGPTANGYFTGTSSTKNWVSGAADGATVTFTNATVADLAAPSMTVSDTTAVGTVTAVTTAGAAATGGNFATNDVVYGAVDIQDNATAAIKTVTIDGFASAKIGIDAAAADSKLDALTTLNLANNTANGAVTVATDSTKLALGVNNITGTSVVNLDHTGLNTDAITVKTAATVADLTINATGKDSTFTLTAGAVKDLTINAAADLDISTAAATNYATVNLKTVDVNGAGAVDLGVLTNAALNSFDASGNTGGVTAEINTATGSIGTITEYVFSAGNDDVELAEAAVNTKVSLGAGDDKITLDTGSSTATVTKVIDGGAGTDTIHMDATDAVTNTSGVAFQELITGFEKLSIGAVGTRSIVNLDNLDDINYVISNGTTAGVAIAETTTITPAVAFDAGNVFKVTVNGTEYSYTTVASDDADKVVTGLKAAIIADKNALVTATGTSTLVLNSKVAGNDLTITTSATGANSPTLAQSAQTENVTALTLQDMISGGTVELAAAGNVLVNVKDATLAANTTDTFNIITSDAYGTGTGIDFGSVIANGVETLNVTTTNTFVDDLATTDASVVDGNGNKILDGKDDTISKATLSVVGDKATTVNVDGAGDLILTTLSTTLTKVDATNMTGALTYTTTVNSVTVNGGQGADKLTADADDVKLNGGAGNDTLTVNAGADRAILDGGAGTDTFVIAGAASTSSTYANILSVNTGDVIKFTHDHDNDDATAAIAATAFKAAKVTLSAGATETTQALMDLAINNLALNEMGWFQTGGNTFIVMDAGSSNGTAGFVDGEDMAVMITGLVDLSTASFNTAGTLEIA